MNSIRPNSPIHNHLTHPKYRADVDGLRAIAILSVVCFHAFPNSIKGGFIGVDIFFVISGYLISTIIVGSLERSTFSFVDFYIRRINRIFPALLLVLIACFAFGWFVLFADEYKQLGKHIAGGAGFISNLLFWNESGYFDNAAETKPLLHLWSLGIEEQFYIAWPLMLWLAWKWRLNLLTITIVVVFVSFALNLGKVSVDPVAAFYSPQTRFWELMMGSVLAYVTLHKHNVFSKLKPRLDTWVARWLGLVVHAQVSEANGSTLRNMQSLLGAGLLAVGLVFITKEQAFPGWWALLPTTGTLLIISAGKQAWLNRVVLASPVFVWFGLISFPLYLWHWPLLSFARIVEIEAPSRELRIAAVLLSILLAWLTYKLIEKPIRFGKRGKLATITLLFSMAIVGSAGYTCYKKEGLDFRTFPKGAESLKSLDYFKTTSPEQLFKDNNCFLQIREIGKDVFDATCSQRFINRPVVMLVGDSHAFYLQLGLKPYLTENHLNFAGASTGDCVPFSKQNPLSLDAKKASCQLVNQELEKRIGEIRPDVVVIFIHYISRGIGSDGSKYDYSDFISGSIKSLKERMKIKKVIVVGQMPTWQGSLPKVLTKYVQLNKQQIPQRTYSGIDANSLAVNTALKNQKHENEGISFVSLQDSLCNAEGCLTKVGDNLPEDLLVWDYGHLTANGAKWVVATELAPLLRQQIQ